MRKLLYALLIAAVMLVPVKPNDVGALRPVKVVLLTRPAETFVLQTDTGDWGTGKSIAAALENLNATTPGILYLDTARYLLVSEDALDAVQELRDVMKGKVQLCMAESVELTEETAQFLQSHGQLPQLKTWEKGRPLPLLTMVEKRLIFSKKLENNA